MQRIYVGQGWDIKLDKQKNKGITILGMIIAVLIVCFGVLLIIRVLPPYMQHYAVKNALEDIAKEPNAAQMSKAKIRDKLERRLQVDGISAVKGENLEIEKIDNKATLVLNYERRVPAVANVDFVFKYHEQVPLE